MIGMKSNVFFAERMNFLQPLRFKSILRKTLAGKSPDAQKTFNYYTLLFDIEGADVIY